MYASSMAVSAGISSIPQRDGPGDSEENEEAEQGDEEDAEDAIKDEDDSIFRADDEGDDPLAGLSSDSDNENEEISNIVLCQFEKVARSKTKQSGSRWKPILKNGIMHLNGLDTVFHSCTGDMQF